MNKLVSIVSPCYNGEAYVERFINSIISQTYRPLELIIVNDGSTDKTEEIVLSFKEKLENDQITLKYLKKQNGGLGSAINDGLKLTTGEYLIWPDSDDFLMPESISKRVAFLENNPGFGFVQSDGRTYIEGSLEGKGVINAIVRKDGWMFDNIISGNVVYTPCGWMLKMSAFLEVNPNKEIFPSRYGQDIQMLLPISAKFKCGHLKEVLYGRVDRPQSLSKQVWKGDDAWKKRILGLEEIYVETLKSIGGEALAYIPYIYFRDLRILDATSKRLGLKEHKKHHETLRKSKKLLKKEMLKSMLKNRG